MVFKFWERFFATDNIRVIMTFSARLRSLDFNFGGSVLGGAQRTGQATKQQQTKLSATC
jgi:hypothetical protein